VTSGDGGVHGWLLHKAGTAKVHIFFLPERGKLHGFSPCLFVADRVQ
jgi:hypothetical protein